MADRASSESGSIRVEVAYALPERQELVSLTIPAGTSVREAIKRSGLASVFPEIDPATCAVGVFGRAVEEDYLPAAGDRLEIYRPLRMDPKQARRARAGK